MKFPDNSLISNQIHRFWNNALRHFFLKVRFKTQNVKQNLLIFLIFILILNTLMQTANSISRLQTYFLEEDS